jgi:hypothetical protein
MGRGTREILLEENRTQDFHFFWRTAVVIDRQCRLLMHAETPVIHNGKKQGLSLLFEYEHVSLPTLRSELRSTVRKRQTDS